jgi:hypothetical protein
LPVQTTICSDSRAVCPVTPSASRCGRGSSRRPRTAASTSSRPTSSGTDTSRSRARYCVLALLSTCLRLLHSLSLPAR